MSPRKTRRGAKSEGANETMSETMSTKTEEETPAESQRIARTRRRLTKVNTADSEADQTLDENRSKRKIVQETPSSKSTRSRKKPPLETTVDDSSVPAIVPPRRTRRAKENDTLPEQATLLDSTTANDSVAEKSRFRSGIKSRKKAVKKSNPKSDDECAEVDKINASEAYNVTIIDNMVDDVTSSDAAAPMSIEDDEVHRASIIISRFKATTATPGKRRPRIAKSPHDECTPESSPMTVNLTPHRTTKTPRKSPMNLGSPKSHEASLRLSKTPRKLPIVAESPIPSEKSVTSSTHSTPEKSADTESLNSSGSKKKRKKLRSPKGHRKSPSKVVAIRKFSKSPKIVLRSPKAKSPKKSPRVTASKLKKPTLSKRSTKSPVKSKKSPSIGSVGEKLLSPKKSRASLSPKKSRGSPNPKKSRGSLSPKKSRGSLSPKKSRESLSPKKSREPLSPKKSRESSSPKAPLKLSAAAKVLDSPGTRMSLHLSRVDSPTQDPKSPTATRNSTAETAKQLVQLPTVVLNKISPSSVATPETVTRSRRNTLADDSSKSTPVVTLVVEKLPHHAAENPRKAKLLGSKRAPITDLGTPLRPIGTPRGSVGKSMILSSSSPPAEIARVKGGSGGPMLSSTPRERIRRSLNLSPGLGLTLGLADSPLNGAPVESSTMVDEGRAKRRSFRIEDESNPLISDDESATENPSGDKSRLNGTYEVEGTMVAENEVEHAGNGTYELAEPKTPNLRRKAAKRSLGEMDSSAEERAVKRTCRVRFASPSLEENVGKAVASVVGRSRSATPAYRAGQKLDGRLVSGDALAAGDKFRRRSNSVTNVSLTRTPVAKRRSNSVADGSLRSARIKEQNASVNRLSKPRLSASSSAKKQEVKTPVARKAPNFAQIHQKKFAKMESIVDAKKRVEKRHIAMTSQIPTILPKAVNNDAPPKPTVSAKATTPRTAVNGAYNRYGFKLRKNDAVKLVTQRQPINKSEKKQTENRMLLKGVRTNRRFDLIMKARNINL